MITFLTLSFIALLTLTLVFEAICYNEEHQYL